MPQSKDMIDRARQLRKGMTKEERHLWYDFLHNFQPRFTRQKIVPPYILDFYCHSVRLAIELDGSQHYEADGIAYDKRRTEYLQAQGITVLRFSNTDVIQNFEGVCAEIEIMIRTLSQQKQAP